MTGTTAVGNRSTLDTTAVGNRRIPDDRTMYVVHEGVADPDSPYATRRLKNEHTDGDVVTFNENTGVAQVTKDVGESLIEHYEQIRSKNESDNE